MSVVINEMAAEPSVETSFTKGRGEKEKALISHEINITEM